MKRILFSGLLALAMFPVAVHATSAFYINNGVVANPMVDATNFVNNGTFSAGTALPYTTSNTRNFTNNGSMIGAVGFQFDTAPSASPGAHKMAANFFNGPLLLNGFGTVEATDAGSPTIDIYGRYYWPASYIIISATNIVNKGALNVSANGLLQLTGTNINLSRSSIQVKPIASLPPFISSATNFTGDQGISDVYWAQSNMTFTSSAIYNGTTVASPTHNATAVGGVAQTTALGPFVPYRDGYTNAAAGIFITVTNLGSSDSLPLLTITNIFIPTNVIRQAVFVNTNGLRLVVATRFFPSTSPTNDAQTITVGISTTLPNAVTGGNDEYSFYLKDTLASETARGLAVNFLSPFPYTARPANYALTRLAPLEFAGGLPGNTKPNNTFLYDNTFAPYFFASNRVSGAYAAYAATIDNVVSRPTLGVVTNLPGRVEINADVLDLTRARIRAEGLLTIQARHLVGSSNAVVDAGNISYNLGSTNGNLIIKDLVKGGVMRLTGSILAWSALWNNAYTNIIPNYALSTNVLPAYDVPNFLTNTYTIRLHAFIVDPSGLSTQQVVSVYNFAAHSTNVTVYDNMTVLNSLLFDCRSLALFGNVEFFGGVGLAGTLQNWTAAVAPNVLFFTNGAFLYIPFGDAHFGDDRPPYDTFYNQGTIQSISQIINSTNVFINGGIGFAQNWASDILNMFAKRASFINADIRSGGDMQLNVDSLYLTNTFIYTGGQLQLNVTNSLTSGTVTSGSYTSDSYITVGNGFSLPVKPAISDLLGTSIESDIPDFVETDHIWSGQDRGVSTSGYTNNAAVGRLILDSLGVDSQFDFNGRAAGESNALYVDYLELRDYATNRDGSGNFPALNINSNLVIYYAQAIINGASIAEKMNHKNNDHLRWVAAYVGTFSSTNIVIGGVTNTVNAALAQDTIIDSDGDGTPNATDPTPFFLSSQVNFTITLTNQPPLTAVLKWFTIPHATNHVEFRTNLLSANWLPLTNFPSPTPYPSPATRVTVFDPVNFAIPRYYRVVVDTWLTYPF